MSDKRPLSEMTFTEVFDAERGECDTAQEAMGRVAGRYAAAYAHEFARAAKLEAENERLRGMIGQVRYPDCPATRGIAWRLNEIRERRKRQEAQRRGMRTTGGRL